MTTATQVKYPWRTVVRTVFVSLPLFITLVAEVAGVVDPDASAPLTAAALAATATLQRLLVLPSVNAVLQAFLPWLAAAPKSEDVAEPDVEFNEDGIPTNL